MLQKINSWVSGLDRDCLDIAWFKGLLQVRHYYCIVDIVVNPFQIVSIEGYTIIGDSRRPIPPCPAQSQVLTGLQVQLYRQ